MVQLGRLVIFYFILNPYLKLKLIVSLVIPFIRQLLKSNDIGPSGLYVAVMSTIPYTYLSMDVGQILSIMEGSTGKHIECIDGCMNGFRSE